MINKKRILVVLGIVVVAAGILYSIQAPPTSAPDNEALMEQSTDSARTDGSSSPGTSGTAPSGIVEQQREGRVLFTITDDAVSLDGVSSLLFTIQAISAHNTASGWVTVSGSPQTYDLIKLKQEGRLEEMLDTTLREGTYNRLQFTIGPVVLIKNGVAHATVLPSNIVQMPISFTAKPQQISAVMIDVLADKSLHITTDNQFVFAPVFELQAVKEIQNIQRSGSKVEFFGGLSTFSSSFGMNEIGAMEQNSSGIDSLMHLEIVQNIFVLTPRDIDRGQFTVSPKEAMDAARNHLLQVVSVEASLDEKQPVWRVRGIAAERKTTHVYVSGTSGEILKVE